MVANPKSDVQIPHTAMMPGAVHVVCMCIAI